MPYLSRCPDLLCGRLLPCNNGSMKALSAAGGHQTPSMPIHTIQPVPDTVTINTAVRLWVPALTATLLALACACAGAEGLGGISAEVLYNDNLSRSPYEASVAGDKSLELGLWQGLHIQLADYTALHLQGTLSHQQFNHLTGLSNTRVGGSAELSHKFGLGAEVPVLSFTTYIERSHYHDNHRDQSLYRESLALRQRIAEQWQWSVTASHEWQDGDYGQYSPYPPPAPPLPGNVWDLHAWQLSLNIEKDLGASSWLSSTIAWRDGDIVASTPQYPKILEASTAIAFDPVFGPGIVAYRMSATTRTVSLDWNHSVGENSTLYVGVERQWSHGYENLGYQTAIIRTGFLHNF